MAKGIRRDVFKICESRKPDPYESKYNMIEDTRERIFEAKRSSIDPLLYSKCITHYLT